MNENKGVRKMYLFRPSAFKVTRDEKIGRN